jgi:hypothetical protein
MSKREKIIVSVMAVLVLWGLFSFLKSGGVKGKPANQENAVADLTTNDFQNFQASLPSSNVVAYLEKVSEPYTGDPFADIDLPVGTTNSIAGVPEFIYSGHIKVGPREMAIINGQEYFENEIISGSDYVVEKVFKDRVLLRNKTKGEGKEIRLIESTME